LAWTSSTTRSLRSGHATSTRGPIPAGGIQERSLTRCRGTLRRGRHCGRPCPVGPVRPGAPAVSPRPRPRFWVRAPRAVAACRSLVFGCGSSVSSAPYFRAAVTRLSNGSGKGHGPTASRVAEDVHYAPIPWVRVDCLEEFGPSSPSSAMRARPTSSMDRPVAAAS
jgi:hypothetical protein